jgi:hypothetical protein
MKYFLEVLCMRCLVRLAKGFLYTDKSTNPQEYVCDHCLKRYEADDLIIEFSFVS